MIDGALRRWKVIAWREYRPPADFAAMAGFARAHAMALQNARGIIVAHDASGERYRRYFAGCGTPVTVIACNWGTAAVALMVGVRKADITTNERGAATPTHGGQVAGIAAAQVAYRAELGRVGMTALAGCVICRLWFTRHQWMAILTGQVKSHRALHGGGLQVHTVRDAGWHHTGAIGRWIVSQRGPERLRLYRCVTGEAKGARRGLKLAAMAATRVARGVARARRLVRHVAACARRCGVLRMRKATWVKRGQRDWFDGRRAPSERPEGAGHQCYRNGVAAQQVDKRAARHELTHVGLSW